MIGAPSPKPPAAPKPAPGAALARVASFLFVASGLFVLATVAQLLAAPAVSGGTGSPTDTGFPITFYAAWITAALGAACTVVTLFVFGFRTRWFWWALLIAAALWATLPPLGTALGLVCAAILLGTRGFFAPRAGQNPAP